MAGKQPDARMDAHGKLLPASTCPSCGVKLNSATMADAKAGRKAPGPGDFSVCIGCAQVLRYEPDMTVRNALPEELTAELDLPSRRLIHRALRVITDELLGAQYRRQLETMLANKKAWLKLHPEAEIKVQFNFPPSVCLVAPISAAIKDSYVSANEAGLDLIRALWPSHYTSRREPTVLMVRTVLEQE